MGTQVTLTIPDDVYHRAQQIAQSNRRDVAEVLAESIVLLDEPEQAVPTEIEEALERERAAYLAMHARLSEKYLGHYVAVYGEEVVDHDPDLADLYARVSRQYPRNRVLIRQVEKEPERVYHFRSPR
ncbi:MAG: DUF5678 domain-containing protein [Chloroflexi bacterium]|nr:DUF5678 domain-containing protein [Chloroflexota bacterium]MCI0579962.1 DUF5678 domain-containing protein [Chloroflexota bacterium]MCI0647506.1 DUF5678 domain-containing protein [Chloroflexota bacterium]MCI0728733.1 DUF5678 domain-containing protein [Chloroflexota bacterium]